MDGMAILNSIKSLGKNSSSRYENESKVGHPESIASLMMWEGTLIFCGSGG